MYVYLVLLNVQFFNSLLHSNLEGKLFGKEAPFCAIVHMIRGRDTE